MLKIKNKSGRRDSNPRRPAWEADILPLNYARIIARIFFSNKSIRFCPSLSILLFSGFCASLSSISIVIAASTFRSHTQVFFLSRFGTVPHPFCSPDEMEISRSGHLLDSCEEYGTVSCKVLRPERLYNLKTTPTAIHLLMRESAQERFRAKVWRTKKLNLLRDAQLPPVVCRLTSDWHYGQPLSRL